MKVLRLTSLSCLLQRKRRLGARLDNMALSPGVADFLVDTYREGTSPFRRFRDNFPDNDVRRLLAFGLVQVVEVDEPALNAVRVEARRMYRHCPLQFLQALNFELTYDCRLRCDHCLQAAIRTEYAGARLTESCVKNAIDQARFAGIVDVGVNFTGGEVFHATVDFFDLITHASTGVVGARLNTSADWGHGGSVSICGQDFPSPESVVQRLLECGLDVLAMSVDRRLIQRPSLAGCVSNVANACARLGLPFQVVATGVKPDEADMLHSRLADRMGDAFEEAGILVPMEEVDLGGAADRLQEEEPESDATVFEVGATQCGGKGFFRPHLLHVSPRGESRTCLYGIGLSNLGRIPEETLFAILNRIGDEPVGQAFRADEVPHWVERELYDGWTPTAPAAVLFARWGSNPLAHVRPVGQPAIHDYLAGTQRLFVALVDSKLSTDANRLENFRVIYLQASEYDISQEQFAALLDYVHRGGCLVTLDEQITINGRPVSEVLEIDQGQPVREHGEGKLVLWNWSQPAVPTRPLLSAKGLEKNLRFALYRKDNRLVLHAANYNVCLLGKDKPVLELKDVDIELPVPKGWSAVTATCVDPDAEPSEFNCQAEDGVASFSLPCMHLYKIVELRHKR